MKSISKKIILIIFILILLFSINTEIYAWSEIMKDGKDFIQQANQEHVDINIDEVQSLSGYLYNILLAAGVVIAVIVATVLGVQFMISGAEGQAKVKEMILPFVIGCVVVFGGFGLWKVAITIGNALEDTETRVYEEEVVKYTTYSKVAGTLYKCDECGMEYSLGAVSSLEKCEGCKAIFTGIKK